MANKKVTTGLLVVLAIVIIAALAWYYMYRFHTTLVSNAADGAVETLTCATGQSIKVVSAKYAPPGGGKSVDVKDKLQTLLPAGGGQYTVSGAALGQTAGGTLTFRYKCTGSSTKAGFRPVPISTCGTPYEDHYAVDTGNRYGTVAWDPYSTQSRVSLERYAESPEVAEPLNPVTGVGKGAAVRAMGDRYRRGEALQRLSVFELQPGQPGYMEEVGDGAMNLMAAVTRRSPAVAGGSSPCLIAGADVDSDFLTDGFYDSAVLKEALTSKRTPMPNTLTGRRVGLGSTRLDPRFEPGPQSRVASGDASPSHGGHAGGITLGGFGSSKFQTNGGWDWNYNHGFGDYAGADQTEAMVTERSQW